MLILECLALILNQKRASVATDKCAKVFNDQNSKECKDSPMNSQAFSDGQAERGGPQLRGIKRAHPTLSVSP